MSPDVFFYEQDVDRSLCVRRQQVTVARDDL
jgi:hypothetical protein